MEHLAEPLSVGALAGAAHMSRRTFSRRFREATGTTVSKWVANARLARAQQLLETTELPVERIATEVGFRTALSLRQNFSEQFGTTPTEYRRNFSAGLRVSLSWADQEDPNVRYGSQAADVPPVLSSTAIWSPIPQSKEIGREEALF